MPGSPDLNRPVATDEDPEKLAKDDPLATQVWKMYARTKATLPHAQRMENITWRMMALALKKKRDEEAKLEEARLEQIADVVVKQSDSPPESLPSTLARSRFDGDDRGRRADKGKAKVRVVGFDGTNQDGVEDEE
jgi:GATA-binding protein